MDGVLVGDAGIQQLRGLSQLETLSLSGMPNVSDKTCGPISEIRSLKFLSVESDALTRVGLERLRALDGLEQLVLRDIKVSESEISAIAELTSLNALSILYSHADGASFAPLQKCRTLKHFDLTFTPLSDDVVLTLRNLDQLQSLTLLGDEITDDGLRRLGELKNLSQLTVSASGCSDETLDAIANLSSLEHLHIEIQQGQFTDQSLERLKPLKSLRSLSLVPTTITEMGVHDFKAAVPNVRLESAAGAPSPVQ